jgi:hypothetical protein
MSDEENVSKKYRELGAEEPPRALDEAILAAARRGAGAGPASLHADAARGGRQRWTAPFAAAAVLVLAVAVTLNMQVERPGIESPVPETASQSAPQAAGQPVPATSSTAAKEELKPKATADLKPAPRPAAPAVREPQPFAANRAPERAASRADDSRESGGAVSGQSGEAARQMEERASRDAEAAERAPQMGEIQALAKRAERADIQAKPRAAAPADSPERELERIAELRAQGRHEEADKALAEFRRRHPEFRIPDATRGRVERR